MRIIFIRHGDPDYSIDSLTEKGFREAKLLSERVKNWKVDAAFVSPLGRAKDTASFSLEKLGMKATTCDWLREFDYSVLHEDEDRVKVPWDFYPETWTKYEDSFSKDKWTDIPILNNPGLKGGNEKVKNGIDEILKEYGYSRYGNFYKTDGTGKDKTIVCFCHLGVICVILGHLLNVSPVVLWHGLFLAPTSVTVGAFEERTKDHAYFRLQAVGDTRHLTENGEPVSSAGYFTDTFMG